MHVSPHDTRPPVQVGSGGADDVDDAEDDVDEEVDGSLVDDSVVDDGSGLETGGTVTVVVCRESRVVSPAVTEQCHPSKRKLSLGNHLVCQGLDMARDAVARAGAGISCRFGASGRVRRDGGQNTGTRRCRRRDGTAFLVLARVLEFGNVLAVVRGMTVNS